jgi:hypothetical protein
LGGGGCCCCWDDGFGEKLGSAERSHDAGPSERRGVVVVIIIFRVWSSCGRRKFGDCAGDEAQSVSAVGEGLGRRRRGARVVRRRGPARRILAENLGTILGEEDRPGVFRTREALLRSIQDARSPIRENCPRVIGVVVP